MYILTRWGFRMARANRARTITVILAVVGMFALMTSSLFVSDARARAVGALGAGVFAGFAQLVCVAVFGGVFFMLFSCFSVTVNECRRDSRILTAAGSTARQIRHNLLQRALMLDLVGAAVGIPLGVAVSRLLLDAAAFRKELLWYFLLRRTGVGNLIALLVVPCAMLFALLFSYVPHRRRRRPSKHGLFRNTLARRVFGVGGTLGHLHSRKNRRIRVIFTLSFAAVLTAIAALCHGMLMLSSAQPVTTAYDVELLLYDASLADTSTSRKFDALLQTCRERGWIEDAAFCEDAFPYSIGAYCVLDNDWLTDEALRLQTTSAHWYERADDRFNKYRWWLEPFLQDGKPMQYCDLLDVLILDNASFDRYARENGIDAGTDGTLLYHPGWYGVSTMPPLKPFEEPRDVTLYCRPSSFDYEPDPLPDGAFNVADWVRASNAASVRKTVRLAGAVSQSPFPVMDRMSSYKEYPMWVVPERLADMFADLPQLVSPTDKYYDATKQRFIYLRTQAHEEVCALFEEAFRDDPYCFVDKENFGVGFTYYLNTDVDYTGRSSYAAKLLREHSSATVSSLYITDLQEVKAEFTSFQASLPQLQTFLLLFAVGILCIGILNTAHLNRLTRRRENAVLDSIGMDGRQKTGMLLYESARYALHSALLAVLGVLGYHWFWCYRIAWVLLRDCINAYPDDPLFASRVQLSLKEQLWTFGDALGQIWWVLAIGAALIFVLLVVTDKALARRTGSEELIQILKDDSWTYD